ncbi:hypothetical protein ACP70R_023550 [Stipagrostis hirtigluma subsp. patula]
MQAAFEEGNLNFLKKMARGLDKGQGEGEGEEEAAPVAALLREKGAGALHHAAAEGKLDVCRYLVEDLGFDVDVRDDIGETPLFHAANRGRFDVTRYLLDHGADPTIVGQAGSPLHGAAAEGHCETVRLLLSRGSSVDTTAVPGTPLHLAAGHGQDGTVKILLEHHANPNKVAGADDTPLGMAIWAKSLECVKLLIKAGADVNFVYSIGATYLTLASFSGLTEIMKCLLEAGANPNIPDEFTLIWPALYVATNSVLSHFGRTPIEFAALQGRRENVEILFPLTSHIPKMPDWSVDGIISHVKSHGLPIVERQRKLKRAELKLRAREAFKNKDYLRALTLYNSALEIGPSGDDDAALLADRSLCWLRLEDGENALLDANKCRMRKPDWPKACYRQGSALMLLQDYEKACQLFAEGLKLDPTNAQIENALRGAHEARKNTDCF